MAYFVYLPGNFDVCLSAGGFASRNYLDLQHAQMKLNNLATCGLSFSAVESSMKLCNDVLCLPSWKL